MADDLEGQSAKIATPWPSEPIIWLEARSQDRHEALRQYIKRTKATHLIREVAVSHHLLSTPPSRAALEDAVVIARREFASLAEMGIAVADTDWFIWDTPQSHPKLLARVAIIDGLDMSLLSNYQSVKHQEIFCSLTEKINGYLSMNKAGERLADIESPEQYVHGHPRDIGQDRGEDLTYLVDIEPRVYRISDFD